MRKIFTIAILTFSINAFAQKWTTKTPMPAAVNAAGVAVVNNIIYVIGGSNPTTNLNTVYAYDPSNDTWATKAPMNVNRGELAVAAVNGKIYAIGGYNTTAVNTVEEYDPIYNSWTTKAPMPTTRSVISCEVINNKIYVVGGWPGNLTTLEEYTPATNTWATKTPCSLGRNQINGCAVINNKLFFIGGKNAFNSEFYTINEAYDPSSDTWTKYEALPQQLWSGATAVLNNEIHYFGGTNGAYAPNFSNHYIYNSTTDSWTNGLSMIHKRSRQIAAAINNKIYVIGGVDSVNVSVNWNEEYSTNCTPTSSTTNLTIPSTNLPYTWNGLTFNNSGSQTATLTNANGCDSSATLNLTVTNTIPSYLPTNGLIGYWPFNGNANDESGNGNHGTVNGATLTTDRNGVAGKAFSFDGVSNSILIAHSSTFNFQLNNKFSISFWSRVVNLENLNCILFDKQENYGSAQLGWNVGIEINKMYNLYIHRGSGGLNPLNYGLAKIKQWSNVVYNWDNGLASVFIDGVLSGMSSYNDTVGDNIDGLLIGNNNFGAYAFNGSLDDIAIYNRALTQQEITQLYTGTVTYNIDASSGTNGTINPSGSTSVNLGASQTYTFTPNSGYWIDSVIVNGVKVPTTSSYTFSNVSSNQSIRVTYRILAAALAAANICANDTTVATVNLPANSLVRATTYYSNIYLFNQNNSGNAYKYNVNDRKYTAIADKPTPCVECGVAEANGKIYCFNTNGSTQAYDIASNTWQTINNQPNSSTSSVYAVSINNKIYVLGTNANNQNTFTQYNPLNNTYTAQAIPNQQSSQSRLVAYNNLIYKIGGINTTTNTTSPAVEVYNPSNNTWTSLPDLPEALSHVGATNYDNKLYVFGGKQSNANTTNPSNSNKVYVFDIAGNTWYAQSNTLNFQRANIEAKTANGLVYLFGGTDSSNTTTNQANRYFCKDQLCTCKWAEYVCNGVSSDNPCPTSSLYRPGTVFCNGYATKVVEVTNPITGKIWMDRNLGATRVATSSTDTLAYGDLYQWGRGADGHQCRNSDTTSVLSTNDQPGHGNFILAPNSPNNWRTIQNDNLWQGVNGVNNPCPSGFRIPTFNELEAERVSWSQNYFAGAISSPLRLPLAGGKNGYTTGEIILLANSGFIWSNTVNGIDAHALYFFGGALVTKLNRIHGLSVRCIKD